MSRRRPRKPRSAAKKEVQKDENELYIEKFKNCFVTASEDLEVNCSVCTEIYCKPLTSKKCKHTLCIICWSQIIKSRKCPICRAPVSGRDLLPDELKDEIIYQLKANCKRQGCSWKGTVWDFIFEHHDNCVKELANLPSWVKESNENKAQIITMDDEIKRSENTLELLREIPQASLISRAYKKFKEKRKYSPCRGLTEDGSKEEEKKEKPDISKEINSFMDDMKKFTKGFSELNTNSKSEEHERQDSPVKKTPVKKTTKDLDNFEIDFDEDSEGSDKKDEEVKLRTSPLLKDILKSSAKRPENERKHEAYVVRKERQVMESAPKMIVPNVAGTTKLRKSTSQITVQDPKLLNNNRAGGRPKIDYKAQFNTMVNDLVEDFPMEMPRKRKREDDSDSDFSPIPDRRGKRKMQG